MKPKKLFLLNKDLNNLIIYILAFFFLHNGDVLAKSSGTTGASTLKIVPSARAFGMAEAFTGIADDVNTIYFNPAGLSLLDRDGMSLMYKKGIADTGTGVMNIAFPVKKIGSWGFSVLTYYGGIAEIFSDDGSSKKIEAQRDYLFIGSFAPRITKEGAVGFNVKVLNSTLAENYSATAYAVDLGILIKSTKEMESTFGVVLQNIDITGKGIKYIKYSDPLPLTLRLGWGYRISSKKNPTTLAIDGVKAKGSHWEVGIGLESQIGKVVEGRLGYKFGYDFPYISAGIGIQWGRFDLDIGASLLGYLGFNCQFSTGLQF